MNRLELAVCILALLPLTASAQCVAPPAGYGVTPLLDQVVTWSDGFNTYMDLYRPSTGMPCPGSAWPGVLVVHGGGGRRNHPDIAAICTYLADRGYVTYAYDVRAQGDSLTLNPPGSQVTVTRPRKLLDSAESHGLAQQLLPGLIDAARLGVTGGSQGGNHAFEAAAYSQQPLPETGYVTHYPRVLAVVPEIAALSRPQDFVPDGLRVSDQYAGIASSDPLSAEFQALLSGDFATARALLDADPEVNRLPLLQQSQVPMLISMAFHDWHRDPNVSVNFLPSLLPQKPRRVLMTSGGHGTPKNVGADLFKQDLRRRWFDRFLKGTANGVDTEHLVTAVVLPLDPGAYLDPDEMWPIRTSPVWPPAAAGIVRYLRSGGSLSQGPPAVPEPGLVVDHAVPSGYGLVPYLVQGGGANVSSVLSNIPLDSRVFTGPVLTEAVELLGRPLAELHLDVLSGGRVQLTATLLAVDPQGAEVVIASGTSAYIGGQLGPRTLDIELSDMATIVPAGHALRVRIENISVHRPTGQLRIPDVPEFVSSSARIRMEPMAASRIRLPIRSSVQPSLVPVHAELATTGGIAHAVQLSAGPTHAGELYYVAAGATGQWPGTVLPGGTMFPVNWDWVTDLNIAHLNTGPFQDFTGWLDGSGRATATVTLPAPVAAALAGSRFTLAGLWIDAAGSMAATNAVTLVLR